MAEAELKPVADSVAKVDGEVAIGEDLEFQRKWWRFENAVWVLFAVLLVLDLAGAFGRGPLSHARAQLPDRSLDVRYERIERTGTPSSITVTFGPQVIHNGQVRLFVSQSFVKELGAQRVAPAPYATQIGGGGLTYIFPASTQPAVVEFALQPSGPGRFPLEMSVPGQDALKAQIVVMP